MTPVLFSADKPFLFRYTVRVGAQSPQRMELITDRCLRTTTAVSSTQHTCQKWRRIPFFGGLKISPNHRHGRKLHGHGPTISFNLGEEIPGVHCSILGPETKSRNCVVSRFPVSVQLDVGEVGELGKKSSSLRYGKL